MALCVEDNWKVKSCLCVAIITALWVSGCSSIPSQSISASQFEYNEHLRYSAKSQILHNIVGLQHYDAPFFLTASSVLSQLSKEGAVSTELAIGPASNSDLGSLGGMMAFKESPTITYLPLQGENYARLLLTPIPPPLVLALIESGWPIDMLIELSVKSVNGVRNDGSGFGKFSVLTQLLVEMKKNHDFVISIRKEQNSFQAKFVINPNLDSDGLLRIERLRDMLRMTHPASNEFHVVFNEYPTASNELGIVTRSLFEIMSILGNGLKPYPNSNSTEFLRIFSSKNRPSDFYVMTRYRDNYYWIEAGDTRSEKAFLLTQLLLEINNSASSNPLPILSLGAL